MRCEVSKFEIAVGQNDDETSAECPTWKIFIKIKFESDEPKNWGELRAYGGSWSRVKNSTHEIRDIYSEGSPAPDSSLKDNPRRRENSIQLVGNGSYPFWGHKESPSEFRDKKCHLDNDQHIEIFYKDQVSGVPRSMPKSRHFIADDNNKPDNITKAVRPHEIDLLNWDIVGRDEPMSGTFQLGDEIEYWHQAEFQVRVPHTTKITWRKRLFCRVHGKYPEYKWFYEVV